MATCHGSIMEKRASHSLRMVIVLMLRNFREYLKEEKKKRRDLLMLVLELYVATYVATRNI